MSQLMLNVSGDTEVSATVVCDYLHTVLDDGNEPERCLAVQVLGRVGSPAAVDLLIDSLRDPDPDVRCDAGNALAALGAPRAVGPLIVNLKQDPVGEAKVIYIRALQILNGQECVDLLGILARGRGEHEGVIWEDDYSGWDDWLDVQNAAIEALGVLSGGAEGESAVTTIVEALEDPAGQDLWAVACLALARIEPAGCVALGDLTSEATPLNRKRVATALAEARCSASENLLERLMGDANVAVRLAVVESGAARDLNCIYQAGLRDTSSEVRAATIKSFENVSIKALTIALSDAGADVRIAACKAIERGGKPIPCLGLAGKIKKILRTGSPDVLAAMITALAVAEPDAAADLIEDIVNHPASATPVRLASLQALGKLGSSEAESLLTKAAADTRQDVRLAAISALGRIAKNNGSAAGKAVAVLACAIGGDLVSAPPDWQPQEDKVVYLTPKKGAEAAGDDGEARLRLDREGNIMGRQEAAEGEDHETVKEEFVPVSTLGAILDFQPEPVPPETRIEMDEADLAFLELTGSRPGRRRISLDACAPVHLDVRRLAACVAGEVLKPAMVPALASAAGGLDRELCEVAIEALGRLAAGGIDIMHALPALVHQTKASELTLRCRALTVLATISSELAGEVIRDALGDPSAAVRAAGVTAAAKRDDTALDLSALCGDPDRRVRLAAARQMATQPSSVAVPVLLEVALAENGVHKKQAAGLMAGHGDEALRAVFDWVSGDDPQRRIAGLEMLPVMLQTDICHSTT